MNLSLGKRAEWGEGGFSFGFMSHYPTVFLIENEIIFLSSCLLPMMVAGE